MTPAQARGGLMTSQAHFVFGLKTFSNEHRTNIRNDNGYKTTRED